MNTTQFKLKYQFRIHNLDELDSIFKFIRNRRFGVYWFGNLDDQWTEYFDEYAFRDDLKKLKQTDFMIRCYFNNDYNLYKFQKKLRKELPEYRCGNTHCCKFNCKYHIDSEPLERPVEWLWRCIANDEDEPV